MLCVLAGNSRDVKWRAQRGSSKINPCDKVGACQNDSSGSPPKTMLGFDCVAVGDVIVNIAANQSCRAPDDPIVP